MDFSCLKSCCLSISLPLKNAIICFNSINGLTSHIRRVAPGETVTTCVSQVSKFSTLFWNAAWSIFCAMHANSLQSRPLCDQDRSPPGSFVLGFSRQEYGGCHEVSLVLYVISFLYRKYAPFSLSNSPKSFKTEAGV